MRAALLVLLLGALMLLAGCRTMQTVDHGRWESLPGTVGPGDRVEVVTRDGRVESFVVTEVTADALIGADTRVARDDIARLQVNAVHKGRTFGAAFGAAGTVLLLLLASAMASMLGG